MGRHKLVLILAAVAVSATTGAPAADAVPGTMVLPGLPGEVWTRATDINNAYVVVGTSGVAPVRWDSGGRLTALPAPPELLTLHLREITDSGFIIGNGRRDDHEGGSLGAAFLWNAQGNLTTLQSPPGSTQTFAADVNSSGVVVGSATAADGLQHAVRWDAHGRVTELPKRPGGNFNHANAVNDHGTVAGYSDIVIAGTHFTHAVTWNAAGQISDLGGPRSRDALNSQAQAINNAGTVAGVRGADTVRWDPSGHVTVLQPTGLPTAVNDEGVVVGQTGGTSQDHPIRWDQHGQGRQLGDLGYATTLANSINRFGTIVGSSEAHSVHPGSWAFSRAARWDAAGNVTDLGDPVGAWNEATGINDSGAICGTSGDPNGPRHAVVWRRWRDTGQPA